MHRVTRRTFLKSAAAGAAMTTLAPAGRLAADSPDERPNVLIVLADQWRFSAFGYASDPLARTPTFDRFAAGGVHWTRAYAANPLCTPNRSALITGRFPHQTGMTRNDLMLPPAESCLARPFAEAGYATHYIGKWHMDGPAKPGYVPKGWRRRGFGTFIGFNRGHSYYRTPTFNDDGTPLRRPGYEPTVQTDLAIAFLKAHRAQPFLCFLSWGPPHMPYRPPKAFNTYPANRLEWRPNVPKAERKKAGTRRDLAGYYGLCTSLDHEFDRLLKALDDLGLAGKTLVVFTSDHGDMHGSHGLHYKQHPQEESLHVPLLMRVPGDGKGGRTIDVPTSTIDLMPTLLGHCGLTVPAACTGRDLSAALGGRAPESRSIYAEGRMGGPAAWRAVVREQHKLVINRSGAATRLFDLEHDPYEMIDLAGQPKHAALEKDLLADLHRWAKRTGDPFPEPPRRAAARYPDPPAGKAP